MRLRLPSLRSYATIAPSRMSFPSGEDIIEPRLNVLSTPLLPVAVGSGPTTGFFRNNFCDASPLDRASHTVAALLTPSFLDFSAAQGNDLRPLFPALKTDPETPCLWCICASRWAEALFASRSHPLGDAIVPRVILESTHEQAERYVPRADLERFAVGGNGDGFDGPGARIAPVRPGR